MRSVKLGIASIGETECRGSILSTFYDQGQLLYIKREPDYRCRTLDSPTRARPIANPVNINANARNRRMWMQSSKLLLSAVPAQISFQQPAIVSQTSDGVRMFTSNKVTLGRASKPLGAVLLALSISTVLGICRKEAYRAASNLTPLSIKASPRSALCAALSVTPSSPTTKDPVFALPESCFCFAGLSVIEDSFSRISCNCFCRDSV